MRPTTCITSFVLADLANARVLAETVKAAHPDWTTQAVVIEEPGWDLPQDAFAPFDIVTPLADLAVPRFRPWIFSLDIRMTRLPAGASALSAALVAGTGTGQAIYLDADSAVFHPLDLETSGTTDASALLVPQQITANIAQPAIRDGELASMRLGIFSPGFIVARDDPQGRAFADWLARMVQRPIADTRLADAPAAPLLCNLAPALFDNLAILRDPGYNVGSANISQRHLLVSADGAITVNGAPLRHFQFPRPGSPAESVMERHGRGDLEIYELANWYRRQTARTRVPEAAVPPWSFGRFADGTAIPSAIRRLWRERDDLYSTFEDPFAVGPGTFHAWLGRERPDLLGAA